MQDDMGRKLTRPRPSQGAKLSRLRQEAGLSQYDLAHLIGVTQSSVAFWELSDKPPRSDVLPKLAKALGVRIEDILNGAVSLKGKRGPKGKLRKLFDEVSNLPRRQKEQVIEFVSAFVEKQRHG
jgi:transcriptional regulator with XRE-family HTH domain